MPGFELWGEQEKKEVNDVLESGILMRYGFDGLRNGHWKSKQLESAICETFGVKYAQLTSSGTSALTTALTVLGVGAGDEVIMPSFTFVASFEAVLSVGAVPVLVDVDDTLTLSPEAVRQAITPKTKCVMPVHMCGSMADLQPLLEICRDNNLVLLEDACQSIGATYHGKALGTIGHAGSFSFDFVKTMTCGEGGVVMTNDQTVYTNCDAYTDHGHDHLGVDRGADLHPFLGYNFRISELHAAVGLAQIRRLPEFLTIQKRNHTELKSYLAAVPGVEFRRIPDPSGDSCTFISWFLPTEDMAREVMSRFKQEGIAAGNFYWFDNNWHYIRKWDHLKTAASHNRLSDAQTAALTGLAHQDFTASDAIMGRCISTSISLLWTPEQIREKGTRMAEVVRSVIQPSMVR